MALLKASRKMPLTSYPWPVFQETEWIPSLDDLDNAPPGTSYVSEWDFLIENRAFIAPSELMDEQEETSE